MSTITPRLAKLLQILLENSGPVTVRNLSEHLNVSRRTIFRELEKAEAFLEGHGLALQTRAGEGLFLEGQDASRSSLSSALADDPGVEPSGRRERHLRLLLALLQRSEQQKLFSYADELGVSVATISHDLDILEPRLARFGLRLARRQGYGVSIESLDDQDNAEADIRRAIMDVLRQMHSENLPPKNFPSPEVAACLNSLTPELDALAGWMTPASRQGLDLYLLTTAERLREGHALQNSHTATEFEQAAHQLADLLEAGLSLPCPAPERAALSLQLAACRRNTGPQPATANDDVGLAALACRMMEEFDPDLAPLLKLDELLLNGLVSHLRSAVVRLEEQVWADDPLEGDLARAYPDLVRKTRKAASILETMDQWMPDSEISFLAAHFGAAMLRLSGRGMRKRTVRAVIVCVNGIGTSHLLAAQLKRRFGSDLELEVGGWNDFEEWKSFDFMISTTPVERATIPVVVVPPVLDDHALARIREEMELRAWVDRATLREAEERPAAPLAEQCRYVEKLAGDMADLLERVAVERVEAAHSLADLSALVGAFFAESQDQAGRIEAALIAREKISTQVIPELGIVLLHCRDDSVTRAQLALLLPKNGHFTGPGLKDIRSCLVMLMPLSPLPASLELMGQVSSLLLEDPQFLDAVREGREGMFRRKLEELVRSFLPEFITQKIKG